MSSDTAFRSSTVTTVDGVPLRVLESGDPARPALVLVHGVGASADVWAPLMHDSRLRTAFRMVAFDLRGHGPDAVALDPQRLAAPAAGDPFATWSLDLQAVLDHTGPAHLVGWSFGCTVISTWLRSAGARPWWESSMTKAVLSCASDALGPADSTDPVARLATEAAVSDVIHCAAPDGAPAYARRMLAVDEDAADLNPSQVQLLERSATQADEHAVAAALVPFDDRGYWRDLTPDRKRRMHVVAAELDQFFDLAALTDCWAPAGLEITVIDGAPHAAPLTHTDEYARVLLDIALPTKEKP